MAVNKVVINTENGAETLIDLTRDSITPETLAEGATAHDASGNEITGTMPTTAVLYTEQTLTEEQKEQARANIGAMAEPTIKRQYVKKSNITNDYFWFWYEGLSLPYKHAYEEYSLVEPLILDAGTYYLSAVEHAYSWIVFNDGTLQRLSDYEPAAANHTNFVLTLTERCTLYLGYHTPSQVSATVPYVIDGNEPLENGEYFEGARSSNPVLLYTEQTLTDEQKEQARKNIGAMGSVNSKRQYVIKANMKHDYFWFWYEGNESITLPFEYACEEYSLVEPLVLDADTYYLSAVEHAYSWIVFSDGTLQRLSDYEPAAANHTDFVLTLTEKCTLYLGYHTPTQVSASTPYVIEGGEPLENGEYFEGEYNSSLESISPYNRFVDAYIKNGELVANELNVTSNAVGHYTGVKMDAHIKRLCCRAKFPAKNYCLALVTTNRGSSVVGDITKGSIHLVFGCDSCHVAVFDVDGREELRTLGYYSYTVPTDMDVPLGFDINEATNTLTIYLPDGTTKTVTDDKINELNGRYAIWEHFYNKLDTNGVFNCVKITQLYCKDASGEVLDDNLRRFDGAIGVAPTGQTYRQFTSHNPSSRDFKGVPQDITETVYHSVANNLTNCTNSNSATKVADGKSYTATISANNGYEVSSIVVTMGGSPVTVTNGAINIASVTGDIVITADAEKTSSSYTNLAVTNATNKTDWGIWCNDAMFGGSGEYYGPYSGQSVTNWIEAVEGDTFYIKGLAFTSDTHGIMVYDSNKAKIQGGTTTYWTSNGFAQISTSDGVTTFKIIDTSFTDGTAYIRFAAAVTGTLDDVVITRNQPIE